MQIKCSYVKREHTHNNKQHQQQQQHTTGNQSNNTEIDASVNAPKKAETNSKTNQTHFMHNHTRTRCSRATTTPTLKLQTPSDLTTAATTTREKCNNKKTGEKSTTSTENYEASAPAGLCIFECKHTIFQSKPNIWPLALYVIQLLMRVWVCVFYHSPQQQHHHNIIITQKIIVSYIAIAHFSIVLLS